MSLDPTSQPDRPEYFDAMFAKSDDPWKFQSRWYERRKRALTLACLPSDRYSYGFEPGCANGELSARLGTRCEKLLVSDGVDRAVALTRERLKDQKNVEVRKAWLPKDWPRDKFDLIVLSEFLFYLKADAVEEIAWKAQETLTPGGVILACHWRHPIEHCVITGDDAHKALEKFIQLPNQCHVVEPDLRIDVWCAGPTVAAREGLT
ncbi:MULTISPECIES: SAM-dependent methyltransferase [Polaromonas]|uniref:SAM-dependent methyltransferase n=1 Tax=Polaromonas aquatica TaxID=332657 RepID=A0ABW1U585_9BURK